MAQKPLLVSPETGLFQRDFTPNFRVAVGDVANLYHFYRDYVTPTVNSTY